MFLNIIKHLLPHARAWRLTPDKLLRQFFDGLSGLGDLLKIFFDEIFNDLDPQKTRELSLWENQFGLRDLGLTEQERRDRLSATWQSLGGQDPRYIQDTLQAHGFNVWVHEWWTPGSEPAIGVKSCATARDPFAVLSSGLIVYINECGELLAECGERTNPAGYPLVNKILKTERDISSLCGELLIECGEADATCGDYDSFINTFVQYTIPTDTTKWPYFIYIGDQTYGNLAQVDPKRKDEFESLCLKICPAQQWLGILVEYI